MRAALPPTPITAKTRALMTRVSRTLPVRSPPACTQRWPSRAMFGVTGSRGDESEERREERFQRPKSATFENTIGPGPGLPGPGPGQAEDHRRAATDHVSDGPTPACPGERFDGSALTVTGSPVRLGGKPDRRPRVRRDPEVTVTVTVKMPLPAVHGEIMIRTGMALIRVRQPTGHSRNAGTGSPPTVTKCPPRTGQLRLREGHSCTIKLT